MAFLLGNLGGIELSRVSFPSVFSFLPFYFFLSFSLLLLFLFCLLGTLGGTEFNNISFLFFLFFFFQLEKGSLSWFTPRVLAVAGTAAESSSGQVATQVASPVA